MKESIKKLLIAIATWMEIIGIIMGCLAIIAGAFYLDHVRFVY